ncbi:hypothetical protein ACPXB3_22115 [Gordonia sp. DT219]
MIGVILLSATGLVTGAIILIDLVRGAFAQHWEPIEVDRGEIVEGDR